MSSILQVLDKDNVILGTAEANGSRWLLHDGGLYNEDRLTVPITQNGYAEYLRLGNWLVKKNAGLSVTDAMLIVGSKVVFERGQLALQLQVTDPG